MRDCLKNFGIIINDRTDSGHHVFSVSCEGQPWISEFICRFGRIPTLAKIHGGSQVCTDHYDATISYLFHLVFLSVRHRPEARDGCKMLLGKYSNNLIADELKEHYEDVLELLGIEL